MITSPCRRWLIARLSFAVLATLWVVLVDPRLSLPALSTLALPFGAQLDPRRARAWLDSHTFALSALLLASPSPFLVLLGAATFPNAALSLFAAAAITPLGTGPRALIIGALATVLALALTSTHTPVLTLLPAVALAAFLSTRPLAALGETFRALGLHRGPIDPLLAWRPLRAPTPGGRA